MTRGFHSTELAIKARPEYFDEKVLKLADALEEDVKRKNARISLLGSEKSHLKEENRRRKSNEEKLEKENKRLTQKIESLENEMAEQKDELDLARAAVANLRAVVPGQVKGEFKTPDHLESGKAFDIVCAALQKAEERIEKPEADKAQLQKEKYSLEKQLKRARKSNSRNGGFSSSFDVGSHSLSIAEKEEAAKNRKHESAAARDGSATAEQNPEKEQDKKKRKPVSSRQKPDRPQGGQSGHALHRAAISPGWDKLVNHNVDAALAGAALTADENGNQDYETEERDLVLKSVITRHRFYVQNGAEKLDPALAGRFKVNAVACSDSAKAKILYFHQEGTIPYKRLADIIAILSSEQIKISPASIHNWTKAVVENSAKKRQAVLENLLKEDVLHVDESGINIDGVLHWIHTISGKSAVYSSVTGHRGGSDEAIAKSILVKHGYHGAVIHDHFGSCVNGWDEVTHGECTQHIIRYMRRRGLSLTSAPSAWKW